MSSEQMDLDGEVVSIVRTEPMTLERKMDVTDQSERGLAMFKERARVAREQLRIALTLTQPGQWIVMDGGAGGKSVYATAGAADRILRMGYGMRWGQKEVKVERNEDAIVATASADLLMPDGSVYERFSGARRGVIDPSREGGIKGYLKNEQDLIKGALANLAHSAVTSILGLRFLTPEDFRSLGMDLDKLPRSASFQDRGGQDAPGDVPVVPFGKNKGTPITELSERQLDWYIEAARKNIADPDKAKWREKEQRWLDSLLSVRSGSSATAPEDMPPFDSQG